MSNSHLILGFLVLFLLVVPVQGATLHGKVYDLELNEVNEAIIEVNSQPPQRYVSKDGSYTFNLNLGQYIITAKYGLDEENSAEDEISIKQEGDYVYDLFLFPELDIDDTSIDDVEIVDVSDSISDDAIIGSKNNWIIAIVASLVILLAIALYFFVGRFRKKEEKKEIKEVEKAERQIKKLIKKELSETSTKTSDKDVDRKLQPESKDDTSLIITLLKKEGGRTTQKEIRKQIPLSEAKISLMISELEHKGIVEKLKKGRGNILILKKE